MFVGVPGGALRVHQGVQRGPRPETETYVYTTKSSLLVLFVL